MVRFPEQKISIAILSNLATFNPSRLAYRVADIYLADALKSSPPPSPKSADAVRLPQAALDRCTGWYWNATSNIARKISVKEGLLIYSSSRGNETALSPLAEDLFIMRRGRSTVNVKFKRASQVGSKQMIVASGDGEPEVYEAFSPFSPSHSELQVYSGTFYSKELDTEYRVSLNNDSLLVSFAV